MQAELSSDTNRYARGSMVLTLATAWEYLLRFGQKIVLARLLMPEHFGLLGAILASVLAVEALADVGLRQSVIQNHHGARRDYLNAVWWVSLTRGLFLFVVSFLLAPLVAAYFRQPEATQLFRLGFAGILISSVISPRVYVLEKSFKFGAWAMVMQGGVLASTVTSLVLAWIMRDASALVIAHVIEIATRVALSYVVAPFRPAYPRIDGSLSEVLRFARGMFGVPVLTVLFMQLDLLFLGRMVPLSLLGCYVLARSLSDMLLFTTRKVVIPVFLPGLSAIKDDPERLARHFRQGLQAMAMIVLPLMVFMAIEAEVLLGMVYGPSYQVAATAFVMLCFHAFSQSCAGMFRTLFLALGRPDVFRRAMLVEAAAGALMIYPGIKWFGLAGASMALLGAGLVFLMYQFNLAAPLVALTKRDFILSMQPGAVLALVYVVAPWMLIRFTDPNDIVMLTMLAISTAAALVHAVNKLCRQHEVNLLAAVRSLHLSVERVST
jgi:O-antigen/teichoic acid export membrane protein